MDYIDENGKYKMSCFTFNRMRISPRFGSSVYLPIGVYRLKDFINGEPYTFAVLKAWEQPKRLANFNQMHDLSGHLYVIGSLRLGHTKSAERPISITSFC